MTTQIIVHIDLDFFYGQCEQALNPSLVSLPFAIQQKHIVVTCNYLARAAGVKKLQLLTDAKRCCPNLIIVNGEDIQKYRDQAKAVFFHIRSLVGDKVQRLGMDELWIDVTDHILKHESRDAQCSSQEVDYKCRFTLTESDTFTYFAGTTAGHVIGNSVDDRTHTRLKIASHLAAYLRESIRSHFSFTSSAGISCSKLIAKLVGDQHKPDNQTMIYPESHQTYLDNIEVKKIAGVGYTILKILFANITNVAPPPPRTIELPFHEEDDLVSAEDRLTDLDDGEDFKLISKEKEELLRLNDKSLTVSHVRANTSEAILVSWLGAERGKWLWQILHAVDDSVVTPSAQYPKSIGLEDSFLHCTETSEVRTRLLDLTTDLVVRMQKDLMENDKWVRWPSTLRLTPRFRGDHMKGELWRHKRTSRSVPLPVDIFDTSLTPEMRATAVVDQVLLPLFKKMASQKGDWDLSLLNVGVADIRTSNRASGIVDFLKGGSPRKRKSDVLSEDEMPPCPPGLDVTAWAALDDQSRREILAESDIRYLVPETFDTKVHSDQRQADDSALKPAPELSRDSKHAVVEPSSTNVDDEWPDEDENDGGYLCEHCESVIPLFAMDSHVCR